MSTPISNRAAAGDPAEIATAVGSPRDARSCRSSSRGSRSFDCRMVDLREPMNGRVKSAQIGCTSSPMEFVSQAHRGSLEVLTCDVYRHVRGRAFQRLEQHARLDARAAAGLDHAEIGSETGGDLRQPSLQDRDLHARNVVLGQLADLDRTDTSRARRRTTRAKGASDVVAGRPAPKRAPQVPRRRDGAHCRASPVHVRLRPFRHPLRAARP